MIIASRQRPTLIAVSSKTGKVVWAHRDKPKLPEGSPDFSKLKQSRFESSPVIGKPLIAIGPDKTPIVVYTSLIVGDVYQTNDNRFIEAGPQQIWLEALDAKTGNSLWRYALPAAPRNYDFWEREPVAREAIQEPHLAMIDGRPVVVAVHGSKLAGVELATGKEAWPVHDLGFEPDMPPQIIADRSSAKTPLALFVTGRPRSGGGWSGYPALKNTLIGLSLADLTQRWQTTITEPGPSSWPHPAPDDMPQFELADLADGKPMILSPTSQQNPSQPNEGTTSLTLIDPQTGVIQWERPLVCLGPLSRHIFSGLSGPISMATVIATSSPLGPATITAQRPWSWRRFRDEMDIPSGAGLARTLSRTGTRLIHCAFGTPAKVAGRSWSFLSAAPAANAARMCWTQETAGCWKLCPKFPIRAALILTATACRICITR